MISIAWLWLLYVLVAQAAPLSRDGNLEIRENENTHITTGEPATDRTIFSLVSIFCTAVLAFLLGMETLRAMMEGSHANSQAGSRVQRLKRSIRSKRNLMSILLLAMYVVVICYIIVSVALVSGQGLYTYELCDAGTWVCLMFYIMVKGIVYAFLVERVHVVRAPFVRRSRDKVYLACLAPAMVLYTAISINSYFWRVTAMHDSDGRCHFGIRSAASIPILSVNLFTNIVLTGIFFYLLRPVLKIHGMASLSGALTRKSKTSAIAQPTENESAVQKNIRILLWKSIIGSLLVELPVAGNMIQFVVTRGEELGMLCLTLCMVDVFWDALVLHWLTFGSSAAAEKDLLRSTQASSRAPLTRRQESVPSLTGSRREKREGKPDTACVHEPHLEIAMWTESAGRVSPSLS